MRLRLLALGVSLALAVATACTGSHEISGVPPPPPQTHPGPLTGDWSATTPGFVVTMHLADAVSAVTGVGGVTGNGKISGPAINGGTIAFGVFGKDSSAAVRLTYTASQFRAVYFTGQLSTSTRIVGNIDSSGFNHVSVTYNKQ
jgi:hypothetical protein